MCLKYFVEAGAMAVRRVLKRDLKRIAKASGGMSPASCHVPFMLDANNKQIQKTSLMFCVQIHVVKSFLCICNWESSSVFFTSK